MRSLCLHTWEKGKHFLYKAGTYILAVSVIVWFMLNLPWGVADKKDSYLGKAGQVMAPALAPLGFGTWEAASSLITGVIAKEIVVGTMAEIYAPEPAAAEEAQPTLGEDLREIGVSFFEAGRQALGNVVATFGSSAISIEGADEASSPLKDAVRAGFTPLTALGFMVFVLLYMPCVVVAIAMRQEFGGWKWFGVAFAYQTALAWGMALLIYQGGRLLGLGA
jgi:ferrous iron transport protein B